MPVEHCHHVKENGFYCQQPALRGRRHCHTHLRILGRRMRMARERARQLARPLVLPPQKDMDSVMVALSQVLDARAEQRITEATAGLMLYGLQQAASNLKWMEERAARDENKECGERAEEYPGFEAEFGLPEGFDLEQPPEVAFPPPDSTLPAAPEFSPYRDSELAWQDFAPEDVELEELYNKGHEEEYHRRTKELTAKAAERLMEHKRKVAEARWVVEADRRNRERMVGKSVVPEVTKSADELKRERERFEAAKKEAEEAVAGACQNMANGTQAQPASGETPAQAQPSSGTAQPQIGAAEKLQKTAAQAPAHKEDAGTRPAQIGSDAGKKPPKKAASRKRYGGQVARRR